MFHGVEIENEEFLGQELAAVQACQSLAWGKLAALKESWTPVPLNYLYEVLRGSQPGTLLVVGCGNGKRELTSAEIIGYSIGWSFDGFDISEEAVRQAQRDRRERPVIRHARTRIFTDNVTNLSLPVCGQKGFEGYAAALMVGVATSLIGNNLATALRQLSARMITGGHLIISDFSIQPAHTFPEQIRRITQDPMGRRYFRDACAVHLVSGGQIDAAQHPFIIVVRPRGLNWREALDLTLEDVEVAIQDRDYERLAQHRSPLEFQIALEDSGFVIEEHNLYWAYPETVRGGARIEDRGDPAINIQILARKR